MRLLFPNPNASGPAHAVNVGLSCTCLMAIFLGLGILWLTAADESEKRFCLGLSFGLFFVFVCVGVLVGGVL